MTCGSESRGAIRTDMLGDRLSRFSEFYVEGWQMTKEDKIFNACMFVAVWALVLAYSYVFMG